MGFITKRLAVSVVTLVAACPSSAPAANLPPEFNGAWVAAEATNNQCRKADLKDEKNNVPIARVMNVGSGAISFYETRCTINSVKPLRTANPSDKNQVNAEASLACSGEGSSWQAKEIWHVETIDRKRLLIVTALGQTNYRDEHGRKQNTPSLVTTSIYLECK